MARAADGSIIDPYHGQRDLAQRVFRHVSDASLPKTRCASCGWPALPRASPTSASRLETNALMRQMVEQGEVDALVAERVWQELSRGLMEDRPSRMFEVLRACGALARILPELDALWGVPQPEKWHPEIDTGVHVMQVIDCAAESRYELPVRFACLMHDLGKGVTPQEAWPSHHGHEALGVPLVDRLCKRLRVPSDCRDLAVMTTREHGNVGRALELRANTIVSLLERCDAFRKPARFIDMLKGHRMRLTRPHRPQRQLSRQALPAAGALADRTGGGTRRQCRRHCPKRVRS